MRKAINQYLKARKGFKLEEREEDPMDVDSCSQGMPEEQGGKGNDKGKGKSKGKGKNQTQWERKECWERQVESRNFPRNVQRLWQDGTHMERMLGERRRSRETSEQCQRDRENW